MAKVYKGTERVDKFFKHYGVKGMKWKNHTYATDDEPVSTARTASRKMGGIQAAYAKAANAAIASRKTRERDAAVTDARQRAEWEAGMLRKKRTANAEKARKEAQRNKIELEEYTPKTLVEAYSGPKSEAEARERAARVKDMQFLEEVDTSAKQKTRSEREAKNAASAAGNKAASKRIMDELYAQKAEREAKERAGRADNGSGRKIPTSESEARAAAASYVSPALKKRIATEYEEGLARNEREAKNVAGGAGKDAIEYTKRKNAEREAKERAGGAGDIAKKKYKEKKAMEEVYEIVSKGKRSRR